MKPAAELNGHYRGFFIKCDGETFKTFPVTKTFTSLSKVVKFIDGQYKYLKKYDVLFLRDSKLIPCTAVEYAEDKTRVIITFKDRRMGICNIISLKKDTIEDTKENRQLLSLRFKLCKVYNRESDKLNSKLTYLK